MSKLNIDQQTIKELFSNKRSDFLIPDYQRPYAWGEAECQTLWDDIFAFAFPENDYSRFKSDEDEYFLGPIVTFKNGDGKLEIIDGQQRLTTLMLLLRAFFSKFGNMLASNWGTEDISGIGDRTRLYLWVYDSVKNNGADGHVDIHFLNSKTHSSNKLDTAHQNNIQMLMNKFK